MTKKNTFLSTLILVVSGCSSSKNTASCPAIVNGYQPPGISFIIYVHGVPYPGDSLELIKISYYQNGEKKYADLITRPDSLTNNGLVESRDAAYYSWDQNIKTFYLEYPNNLPTDTLMINYLRNLQTNCDFITNPISVNNKFVQVDSTGFIKFDLMPYLINKP
jgi:hypothetical protein